MAGSSIWGGADSTSADAETLMIGSSNWGGADSTSANAETLMIGSFNWGGADSTSADAETLMIGSSESTSKSRAARACKSPLTSASAAEKAAWRAVKYDASYKTMI